MVATFLGVMSRGFGHVVRDIYGHFGSGANGISHDIQKLMSDALMSRTN